MVIICVQTGREEVSNFKTFHVNVSRGFMKLQRFKGKRAERERDWR